MMHDGVGGEMGMHAAMDGSPVKSPRLLLACPCCHDHACVV